MDKPKFTKHGDHSGPRIRASEAAIRVALKAMKAEGLVVGKLSITGGYVEIHVAGIEDEVPDDGGLKDW